MIAVSREVNKTVVFENDYVRVVHNRAGKIVEIHHLPFETTVYISAEDFAEIVAKFVKED